MASMENGSSSRIESSLAAAVQDYLLAGPNERTENLSHVCMWLGGLLEQLLAGADEWSQYSWVDGIVPCTAERVSPSDLAFTGLLIWNDGNKKSNEWKEPLSAAIHVSESSPAHLTYQIRFADADQGLGKCPCGSRHDFPYVPVDNWLFTFASPGAHE
jgi:hypothetical protein